MPVCVRAFRMSVLVGLIGCLSLSTLPATEVYSFHHENVLGTSLEIQVEADSSTNATCAETRILDEVNRLAKIFSSYDASSEFSVWQRGVGHSSVLSPELFQVLRACEHWQEASQGAFNPAVQEITQIWQRAQKRQQMPVTEELLAAVAKVRQLPWKLDYATRTAVRIAEAPLSLNAIAKGAIVDYACQAALSRGDIRGVVINIGGDLRACGPAVQQIRIADPHQDAVNAAPISTIYVNNRAVATSGNYRRGFTVNGQWYSHIIDPRTGQPASHVASATVVAPGSADADALATILNVLPIADGIALVESVPEASCLIVSSSGQQTRSRGWSDLEQPGLFRFAAAGGQEVAQTQAARKEVALADPKAEEANPAKEKEKVAAPAEADSQPVNLLELVVKFELNRPTGAQYRRPYVAIWLEDADEFPVKTAVLWMQTKQPGPRWHRDLLRWYRNDGVRKLADGTDLIGTISSATRNAGEYKAVFDGKDDAGKPLPAGKYTLFIEVAREHGTYQLIRHKVNLGSDPIAETKLKENVEIKSASVEYRARTAEPAAAEPAAK